MAKNTRAAAKRKQTAEEKKREALELKISGVPVRHIAARLGWTVSHCHRQIKVALTAEAKEKASELFAQEMLRLDDIFFPQYRLARSGNTRAALACLKVMERRAKYAQLDGFGSEGADGILDQLMREIDAAAGDEELPDE